MHNRPPYWVRMFRAVRARPYRFCELIAGRLAYGFTILTLLALELPSLSTEAAVVFSQLDAASPMPVFMVLATLAGCVVVVVWFVFVAQTGQGPGRVVAFLPAPQRVRAHQVRAERRVRRPVGAPVPAWAREFAE
jgi:hypothetical protein